MAAKKDKTTAAPQGVEAPSGSPSGELEALKEETLIYLHGQLGTINVNTLVRKNPDVDFDQWLDLCKTPQIQSEMRNVLVAHTGEENRANIDKFLNGLKNGDLDPATNPYFSSLKRLVEGVAEYSEVYDSAKEEAEEFSASMLWDGMKKFYNREVVEGMHTNPLATLAVIGGTGYLIWRMWNSMEQDTKDKVMTGGLIGAGVLIANKFWPHVDPKERTISDYVFGVRSVKSPAYRWFCERTDIESSEKIDGLFAVAETSINKMVQLYREAKYSGSKMISIESLIADTEDPDKIEQLRALDTKRVREALYKSVDELITLSGFTTPQQLLAAHSGEEFASVIFKAYERRALESGKSQDVEVTEEEARKERERVLGLIEDDKRVNAIIFEGNLRDDIPEDVDIKEVSEPGIIRIDGVPYKYELEKENNDIVKVIRLLDVRNQDEVAKIPVDEEKGSEFAAALKVAKKKAHEKAQHEYKRIQGEIPVLAGYDLVFNEADDKWEVKDSSGKGMKVGAKPKCGITEVYIPMAATYTAEGRLDVYPVGYEGVPLNLNDVEKVLLHAALVSNIKDKGPDSLKDADLKIDEKFDGNAEEFNAKVGNTEIKLKYEANRYVLTEVDWKSADNELLNFYASEVAEKSEGLIEKMTGDMKLEEISGFDGAYVREFQELLADKPKNLALLHKRNISETSSSKDMEKYIREELRDPMLKHLGSNLKAIRAEYDNDLRLSIGNTSVDGSDFKERYIDPLQFGGITSEEYRNALGNMLESAFYSGNFHFNPAFEKRYFDNYYALRESAVTYFYETTGHLSDKQTFDGDDVDLTNKVIEGMMIEMQEAYADNNLPQDLAAKLGQVDWVRGAAEYFPINISRVGEKEVDWKDVDAYIGRAPSTSTDDLDDYLEDDDDGTGPRPAPIPRGPRKRPTVAPEKVETDPSNKLGLWTAYVSIIEEPFNELQDDVGSRTYDSLLVPVMFDDAQKMQIVIEASISLKKSEFRDRAKADFEANYDSYYGASATEDHEAGDLFNDRYQPALSSNIDTLGGLLDTISGKDVAPTPEDYTRMVEELVSSYYDENLRLQSGIPAPDASVTEEVEKLQRHWDEVSNDIDKLEAGEIPPAYQDYLTPEQKERLSEIRSRLSEIQVEMVAEHQRVAEIQKERDEDWWDPIAWAVQAWNEDDIEELEDEITGLNEEIRGLAASAIDIAQQDFDATEKAIREKAVDPGNQANIEAYRMYLSTTLEDIVENTSVGMDSQTNVGNFQKAIKQKVAPYEDYDRWAGSVVLGNACEFYAHQVSKYIEPSEVDAYYDVEEFVEKVWYPQVGKRIAERYKGFPISLQLEGLREEMKIENEFMEAKHQFYQTLRSDTEIDKGILKSGRKEALGNYERTIHYNLMRDEDYNQNWYDASTGEWRLGAEDRLEVYRHLLDYALTEEKARMAEERRMKAQGEEYQGPGTSGYFSVERAKQYVWEKTRERLSPKQRLVLDALRYLSK